MRHAPSAMLPNCSSPHRQHPQPVVTKHPDIELTPLDVLLRNGRGADSFVNEGDALCEFLVGVDDGCLRDAEGRVLAHALDDQRQGQVRWPADLAAHREDREGRHWNPMILY